MKKSILEQNSFCNLRISSALCRWCSATCFLFSYYVYIYVTCKFSCILQRIATVRGNKKCYGMRDTFFNSLSIHTRVLYSFYYFRIVFHISHKFDVFSYSPASRKLDHLLLPFLSLNPLIVSLIDYFSYCSPENNFPVLKSNLKKSNIRISKFKNK